MISRLDLQELARLRLEEAEILFSAGKYDGCVYLCGYVVELALKACVCKALNIESYPDNEQEMTRLFKTHNFKHLELLSGLRSQIEARAALPSAFADNWELATRWKPDDRYGLNIISAARAQDTLEALRSEPEGVLTWLSQQW